MIPTQLITERIAFEASPYPCTVPLPNFAEGGRLEHHPCERIGFQPSLVPDQFTFQ